MKFILLIDWLIDWLILLTKAAFICLKHNKNWIINYYFNLKNCFLCL